MMRVLVTATAVLLAAPSLSGQERPSPSAQTVITVTDTAGRRVPFAVVQVEGGVTRVADDSGRVGFAVQPKDSLKIQARRMGYAPFVGWVKPDAESGTYVARLNIVATRIARVTVEDRMNTPLARSGFYDRLQRAQRGAATATFITPEELDLRNPARVSQVLQGVQGMKVTFYGGRPVLSGRGMDCGMTVLLDGRKMDGMVEEILDDDGRRELERALHGKQIGANTDIETRRFLGSRTSVDDLITGPAVAAVEIYTSISTAPVELQRQAGPMGCGIIALWTGSRQ